MKRLETSREVIFNSVRNGFAAAYDSLVLDPAERVRTIVHLLYINTVQMMLMVMVMRSRLMIIVVIVVMIIAGTRRCVLIVFMIFLFIW